MGSTLYGYTNSRIKAMESSSGMSSGTLQRLLEAENLQGAFKVLGETSYASWLGEMEKEHDFDAIINKELQWSYESLSSFVPNVRLVGLLRLFYDFHNVKVVLKSAFMQGKGRTRRWDLLTSLGTLSQDDLIAAVESEDYHMLPYNLGPVIAQCLALWEQEENTLEITRILEQHQFAVMLEMARSTGYPGVLMWCRQRVDAENVRNLLRLRRLGFDAAASVPFLHQGGVVSLEKLQGLFGESPDSWGRFLSYAEVGKVFRGLEETSDLDAMLISLETELDNYLLKALQVYSYDPFAPENVLRFLWKKEIEAKNLRIVFVSKANGMPMKKTKGMLRHAA